MNTKIIKLDLNRILYDKIIAKQGDTKSRFLLFQLLDGSIAFNLTNRSVRAYMVKPDGKEIFNDLIINNYSLGYCTLELTNQVLAVPGTVKIELMVTEEDKKLTSSVFELEVIKSINSEKSIVSTNEFTALLNGLSSLSEYDNYKNEIAAARDGEVNLLTKVKKIDEQLDTKANDEEVIKKGFGTLNDFDEGTRAILQGLKGGEINAVLGDGNVSPSNLNEEILEVLKSCSNSVSQDLSAIFDIGDGMYDYSISNTSIKLECISKTKTYAPLLFKKINGFDVKKIKTTVTSSCSYWIILGGEINNFTMMLVNNSTGYKGIYNITDMTTGVNILQNTFTNSVSSVEVEITDSELKLLFNGTEENNISLSTFPRGSGILTRPRVGICFNTLNTPQIYDIYQKINDIGLSAYDGNIPKELKSVKNDIEVLKKGVGQVNTQQLLKDLMNPFVFTKIKLIGDSITAGVGGTGYSPTGKTLYGSYKQVLPTGACWGNMLKTTIEEQYNKYNYIPLTNENIIRTGITSEQITFDNNTKLGEKWRCENGGNGVISFRFYGDNFYIVHPKLNSAGVLDIYIDGDKVGILDTYDTSFSWSNETQFNCETVGYHDVEIRETGLKNSNSTSKTIFLEAIKIPKTAIVENYGISGIGTSEALSMKSSLIEEDDDIVIVQLGTNDRFKTTCPEKSKYLLKEFIKYCEGLGKKVIQFCSLPASVSDEETRNWTIKDLDKIWC